ncbi:MAG: hypothetical protein KDD62_11335, partial [Bdellovibrionales bacterium]|nr:hypothetical protein [Bdellovibrionales bacterium]
VADCIDGCPKNASRTEPGPCGCSGSAETKLDGTVTCKVKFEVPTKSIEGKKIINPLTGEQLVPDPAKLELESTCCGAALEFPGYKFVNDTKVVLAAKRKSKKSSLKVKYEVTLNELTSKKTKTTKRNTGRQRLSLGKLKPGTNYIVSYKLQGTKNSNNGKERVVASSASSKSISFRTPQ